MPTSISASGRYNLVAKEPKANTLTPGRVEVTSSLILHQGMSTWKMPYIWGCGFICEDGWNCRNLLFSYEIWALDLWFRWFYSSSRGLFVPSWWLSEVLHGLKIEWNHLALHCLIIRSSAGSFSSPPRSRSRWGLCAFNNSLSIYIMNNLSMLYMNKSN